MFKAVTLYTNQLNKLKSFHQNILEMPLIDVGDDSFSLQIGSSTLTFKESHLPAAYHFAFNIPGNLMAETKKWLQARVELNREDDKDEVYYKSFDADAIYFDDPAGNVVEFIGRRTKIRAGDFTPDSLMNISEMSITTPDVREAAMKLQEFGVISRNNNPIELDSLNFLGEGDTFIILVPPKRRWYFSDKISEVCPLEIELVNGHSILIDEKGLISNR
ncbi:glyoxalase [Sporosarcina sp. Marseille-Q4063]|uniref:glyoxalase n=1 Tax=Sporosarcina sp. Marseille-Q4063 TaxID=2810514 RepID=UPI001BAF3FE2|nr:glyoxalase [Sporosarcina sp. Marseille-Q4063]QUW22769.1 glyoxalase [Sporosarcina sp. Marseille-Q4063]